MDRQVAGVTFLTDGGVNGVETAAEPNVPLLPLLLPAPCDAEDRSLLTRHE